MSKVRVSTLAKELGIPSKEAVAWLNDNGEYVKSAASTIEAPVERKLREAFPAAKPAEPKPAKATKKVAATPAAPQDVPAAPEAAAPATPESAAPASPAGPTTNGPAKPAAAW